MSNAVLPLHYCYDQLDQNVLFLNTPENPSARIGGFFCFASNENQHEYYSQLQEYSHVDQLNPACLIY